MGVPGFIYWLVTNVIDSLPSKKDEKREQSNRIVYPIHSNTALVENVIGKQVDNFYIDLNGLIHPCCHPQVGKKPENEEEMMERIIAELLHLARTVSPKNLFYIAVDGVAPAAKQEQQRHRRFVAISENEQKVRLLGKVQNEIEKEKNELSKEEEELEKIQERERLLDLCHATVESKKHHWDHNVISPGTPFMMKCMSTVHRAAKLIATEFPNIKVIVSDSSVPGEGEHKILSYMKKEKAIHSKKFSEMVHVVHGLDADLIMLTSLIGLPNIYSYRDSESVKSKKREKELFYISELGRHFSRVIYSSITELDKSSITQKIEWNNENFVSDVVLLLMYVGNDFLPNVPSLVMHNHAASIIMYSYAKYLVGCVVESGLGEQFDPKPHYVVDYTSSTMINIKNMIKAMKAIREESVIGLFAKLYSSNLRSSQAETSDIYEKEDFIEEMKSCYSGVSVKDHNIQKIMKTLSRTTISHESYDVVFTILRKHFKKTSKRLSKLPNGDLLEKCYNRPANIIHNIDTSLILKHADEIHAEYYQKKFHDSTIQFRKELVKEYLRGIVWAFNYYAYNEPPSWYWRYPQHYAPVLCDILDCLDEIDDEYIKDITTFEKGEPLTPYQQLVSILPKESMDACLPKTYTDILSNPKLDQFFPKSFVKDGNFSGIAYKAVSLLPSIDIELVKSITKEIDPLLTEEESKKNKFGIDIIYTAVDSDVNSKLCDIKEKEEKDERFNENSVLSGVFSKIESSEMVFGTESIQEEIKPSVCAYKFISPHVPIQNAYKHVTSNPIPKTKLICTLTRQLKGFDELGGFVSMSEDQDLSNLRVGRRDRKRNSQPNKFGKRRADNEEESRPKKAVKKNETQKTPLDNESKNESGMDESNKDESAQTTLETTLERKPIKAANKDKKKSRQPAHSKRAERGVKRSETEEKKSPAAPSKKQKKKQSKTEKKESSSSTTNNDTAPPSFTEPITVGTSVAASGETKKKRKRQKRKKSTKTSTTDSSNVTSGASTEVSATTATSAPVDGKQKLKESTNAKFKALLGKFTVNKQ